MNGKEVVSGKIDRVPPVRCSTTATFDIGMGFGAIVSGSYHDKAPFTSDGQLYGPILAHDHFLLDTVVG